MAKTTIPAGGLSSDSVTAAKIVDGTLTSAKLDQDGAFTFNEDSADADFRVESNAYSSMFQVDAGANYIDMGIGTNNGEAMVNMYNDGGHASSTGRLMTAYTNNASFDNDQLTFYCYTTASASWKVMTAYHGDGGTTGWSDAIFQVEGNGDVESDTGYYGTGADDYAEYFESTDGSALPIGSTVVLVDNKVRVSTGSDASSAIIGVVRPKECGGFIGNVAQFTWQGKDKKDDYGAWILEEYTVTDWTVHLPSANKVRHCYATDKIPAKFDYNDGNGEIDLVVPDDAVVRTHDENGIRFKRRIHSEDYNASLKDKYSPRKDRNEWNLIGLLGQVPMTKNQKTGDRWFKMKDISGSVEMWFIR